MRENIISVLYHCTECKGVLGAADLNRSQCPYCGSSPITHTQERGRWVLKKASLLRRLLGMQWQEWEPYDTEPEAPIETYAERRARLLDGLPATALSGAKTEEPKPELPRIVVLQGPPSARPFSVVLDGVSLQTRTGAVRKFASAQSARAAAIKEQLLCR